VEKLEDPVAPITEILRRVPAKQLMALYKVGAFKDADGLLAAVAAARGKLKRGGTPDVRAAARILLADWNDGHIPYYTLPPARSTEFASAEVVSAWARDFDADAVFADERSAVIAHLPSLDDEAPGGVDYFAATTAGEARVDIEAMEAEEAEGPSDGGAMDEGDGGVPAASAGVHSKLNGAHQTEKLYGEEGQFNPKAARADRKRQKKTTVKAAPAPKPKRGAAAAAGGDDDSDFDFDAGGGSDGGEAMEGDE
jgi:nuclear GTP-binding protein